MNTLVTIDGVDWDVASIESRYQVHEPLKLDITIEPRQVPEMHLRYPRVNIGSVIECMNGTYVVRWFAVGSAALKIEASAAEISGYQPPIVIIDEFDQMREAVQAAPTDAPILPKHGSFAVLGCLPRAGDEVVITFGEQLGWRGRVAHDYPRMPVAISVNMTRPDGTRVTVDHRTEYVAKVLPEVPQFTSVEEAQVWMTVHDRAIRPAYAVGQAIRFERTVAKGAKGKDKRKIMDVVMTGRVVGFEPDAHVEMGIGGRGPAYKVLTFDLPAMKGEPKILWVEPGRIVSE